MPKPIPESLICDECDQACAALDEASNELEGDRS